MPHIPAMGTKQAQVNDDIPLLGSVAIRQFRSDAFSNPKLQRYLNRQQVGHLFVIGYSAEESVYYTIQSAIDRGYKVFVVEDAIIPAFGGKSKDKQISSFESMGAKLVKMSDCEKLASEHN
jgi:nicotinamidase-related amidase